MGEEKYKLDEGTLIFGDAVVGTVKSVDFTCESDEVMDYPLNLTDSFEFTTTCTLSEWAWYKLIGAWDFVISICPNRRVAHLCKYGKNERIKRKNFKRAIRIINKECET
jgi:hypothetical protein